MKADDNLELDWGVATRPLPGQTENGDSHLVLKTAGGWLLAVADGLGHGPEAAAASAIFLQVLRQHVDQPPVNLITLSHQALLGSRGIACTIMAIDSSRSLLGWLGVGNVEGVVCHQGAAAPPTRYVTLRGGVVGYRLPDLKTSFVPLFDGDILALATDGITGDFVNMIAAIQPPKLLAGRILDSYAKPIDDALVLIARWRAKTAG